MPRKRGRSTGRRTSRSRRTTTTQKSLRSAGQSTPRLRRKPESIISERRTIRRRADDPIVRRDTPRAINRRDTMPRRLLDRRDPVHRRSSIVTKEGLPVALLRTRKRDEKQDSMATKNRLCKRKKEVRRAVILASGRGGINHSRNYRRSKTCR